MSLNVKLTAPHLSRPGASKPEDSKPDAPKAQDAGSNELWIEIPVAEEEAITSTIHFTDGVKEREAFYLKLFKSSLDDETLSDLRSNIAGHTGSIEISHFPFCGRKGAVVPDSFSIQDYLKECLGTNTEEAKSLDIYMKDTSTPQEKANTSEIPDAGKISLLKSQVDDTAFKWITGTQAKYAPELEQRDWAVISDSNSLCYGIRVIRTQDSSDAVHKKPDNRKADPRGIPIGVERARFPAFRLKKRMIWSDNLPTTTIDGVKLDLRIPDHVIDDRSYVSIYETETDMQSSMATSSFSETDVAAAGSLSYMGFSGSASMSLAVASSQAATSSNSKKSKKVTIAYNFPRITVFLDNRSLELTPECTEALYRMKTTEDFYDFQNVYGEFFSTRVQLGGRLFSTEDVTSSSTESTDEKVKSMKIAAAASFSGYGAAVNVSGSYGKGSESKEMKASRESVSTLTWQANGGDTLLCNQPQEWAPTVAYHWNWRITRQDRIASIFDVAAQIKGMDWVIKEAIPLGLTINPNFDDAVVKPPSFLAQPTKTFTIQAQGCVRGRYMLTCPPSICSTATAAQACNATKMSNFKIDSTLQKWGCILLGPETAESADSDRLYEAENLDGEAQNELKYNTKYRLRNKERGLYVDYHNIQGSKFVSENAQRSKSYCIVFQKPDGSQGNGIIPDKAVVMLLFYESNNNKLGHIYIRARDKKNAYLFCSAGNTGEYSFRWFTITYQ